MKSEVGIMVNEVEERLTVGGREVEKEKRKDNA